MQRKWSLSSLELWSLLNHFNHQGLVNILQYYSLCHNNLWKQSTWFPKCFIIFIHKLPSIHCPLPSKKWHQGIWFLHGQTARPARLSWWWTQWNTSYTKLDFTFPINWVRKLIPSVYYSIKSKVSAP